MEETARWSPGKHGSLRFRMMLECRRALTGMPSFVVAMEAKRYTVSEDHALMMMTMMMMMIPAIQGGRSTSASKFLETLHMHIRYRNRTTKSDQIM